MPQFTQGVRYSLISVLHHELYKWRFLDHLLILDPHVFRVHHFVEVSQI